MRFRLRLLPSRERTRRLTLLEQIFSTLTRGESVRISSFGTFSVRNKAQRPGRNPKTGEEMPILPRRVPATRRRCTAFLAEKQ